MKKIAIVFSFILSVIPFLRAAEVYQIPNSDMEQWETVGEGVEPVGWNTYASAGGSLGSMVQSFAQCSKSTEVRSGATGKYSAAVKARKVLLSIVANGMITTGLIEGNSTTASSSENHNITKRGSYDCPFTGRPDSVTAWVKTAPKSTSQMARFFFDFHGNYDTQDPWISETAGQVVAVAGTNIAYNKNWQRVSVPVYYKGETLTIASSNESKTPQCADERPSYCLASIATNYEAGKGDGSDVLYIDDIAMVYNSKLSSLKVNGVSVSGFNRDKYEYSVDVKYSDATVSYASDGKFATVSENYDADTGILTLTVKGDDYSETSNMHAYKIQFKAGCSLDLSDLKVNGKTISGFNPTVYSYTLDDVYANSTVTYSASECAATSEDWNASANTLKITLSSDGVSKTYNVKFHADYGSQLSALKVSGTSLIGFSPSTYSYTVDYAYDADALTYLADADATVETSYNANKYLLTIRVKGGDFASNATNFHDYSIQYHAPYGSLLSDLKVNGATISGFSPSTYNYSLTSLAYYADKVQYTASDEATVDASYNASTYVLTLKVNGGDIQWNTTNHHTYTVKFHAPFGSQLTALTVNGVAVTAFASNKYSYSVKNSYVEGTTEIGYTANESATVATNYDASANVYSIVVSGADIAQNPENTHTYTISFHDSYGSRLVDLLNNGTTISGFSSDVYEYNLKETLKASSITYTADAEATVEKQTDDANDRMTLVVKGGDYAENNSNTHSYAINFHAPYGSYLQSLKIDGLSIDGFSSTVYNYTVPNTYDADNVTFVADLDAMVTTSYDSNNYILSIVVKGGDVDVNPSNIHTYRISFHAPYGSQLTSLKLNGTSIQGFNPTVYSYSVTKAYVEGSTKITYTADDGANASGTYNAASNSFVITVRGGDVASNPTNTHTYSIEFHDSYGSQLKSLNINGSSVKDFSPSIYEYSVRDSYDPSLLSYVADADASVEMSTDAKNYVVTLRVKGGDYAENTSNVHTYTIQFHGPYGSQLTSLKIENTPVSGFSQNVYSYSVKNTYAENSVSYTVSEEATATQNYDAATNTLTIKVSGGDIQTNAENFHLYTIRFHDSYGSSLTTLKIDRVELPDFSPMKYTYYVSSPYSDVTYSYDVDEDAMSAATYDETSNMLTIVVKGYDIASNPSNTHTYKVQFCKRSVLTSLSVAGSSVANFRETKYAYTLSSTVYESDKVSFASSDGANVISTYDEESAMLTLRVEGADIDLFPTNFHVYTIQFHTNYASQLNDLTLNGATIDGFSKSTYNFLVTGPYSDYVVDYSPDTDAKVKTSFNEADNVLTLTVMGGDYSENPTNTHTYRIQFYAPSRLSAIKVDGVNMKNFSPSTYTYYLPDNAYEDTKILRYGEEGTTVSDYFDETTNELTIRVEGADIEIYTDNFHEYILKLSSPFTSQLKDLKVDGATIASFDPAKYTYIYDGFYSNVNVLCEPDENSSVTKIYDESTYTLTIRVEAGNIDKKPTNFHVYAIEFNDPTIYNSQLKSLKINGTPLSDFSRDGYLYNLDGSYSDLKIEYEADEKATVVEKYDPEKNALILTVNGGNIRKNPENFHVYTLHFTASFVYGSYLSELSFEGNALDGFDSNKFTYTINGEYADSNLAFMVSPLARYCADYDKATSTLTIVVWGGDSETNPANFHTYKILFKK